MDFGRESGCGGLYLAAPPTSARVQNRVEYVELARDFSSNCTRSHWDYRLVVWYNPVVLEVREGRVSTGYQGTTCVCYVLVLHMYEYSRMNTGWAGLEAMIS